MNEEDDLARIVSEAARNQRRYAAFFAWPDRDVEEWGVALAFAAAAAAEPGIPFRSVKARGQGNDPPDCEAIDKDGRRLALEVSELVDRRTVERTEIEKRVADREAREPRVVWALWDRAKLLDQLQARLGEKHGKTLQGGHYDEYIVLIHTDEPNLPIETVEAWITGHTFAPPRQVDRAYLLLSYDPRRQGYPYVRLPLPGSRDR